MPEYGWRIVHSAQVNASGAAAYQALVNTPVDHFGIQSLTTARGLKSQGSIKQFFLENGFTLLEEKPPEHLIIGMVSRPWRLDGGIVPCAGLKEWQIARSSDRAKILAAFGAVRTGETSALLYTETRVQIEAVSSRRKFALYWWVVRPFSSYLRRAVLRRAKALAELLV